MAKSGTTENSELSELSESTVQNARISQLEASRATKGSRPRNTPKHWVFYTLTDSRGGNVRYVGGTSNPELRMRHHRNGTSGRRNSRLATWDRQPRQSPRVLSQLLRQTMRQETRTSRTKQV
jgi:hypothetical protein